MDALHARIRHLDAVLGGPAAFITADAPGHQALKERDAAKAELEALELEWLELEEKRGAVLIFLPDEANFNIILSNFRLNIEMGSTDSPYSGE